MNNSAQECQDALSALSVGMPPRRDDGGFGLEGEGGDLSTPVDPSYVGYGRPQQAPGTSIFDVSGVQQFGQSGPLSSTDYLQSEGDAAPSISEVLLQGTAASKRFPIICLPTESEKLFAICGKAIGTGGTTVCVEVGCRTGHRGKRVVLTPGDLHVKKSPKVIFLQPKLLKYQLSDSVLTQWMKKPESLESWVELFHFASSSTTELPATEEVLKAEKDFATKAEGISTPAAKRQRFLASYDPFVIDPYAAVLTEPETQMDPLQQVVIEEERLNVILLGLDDGLLKTSEDLRGLAEHLKDTTVSMEEEALAMLHNLSVLGNSIGTKPPDLDPDVDSPTLWGTIGMMISKLFTLQVSHAPKIFVENAIQNQRVSIEGLVRTSIAQAEQNIGTSTLVIEAKDKAENTMNFAIEASKLLNEKIRLIVDQAFQQCPGSSHSVAWRLQ